MEHPPRSNIRGFIPHRPGSMPMLNRQIHEKLKDLWTQMFELSML